MKLKKSSSVFVRWLMSYIIMLGMMILASFTLYFYSYNVINQQQERINGIMLEKIQTEVDDYFDSAKAAVISLYMDSEVEKLMMKRTNFDITDMLVVYNAYETMRNKTISYEEFDSIFVYFLHTDTVLSDKGHVSKDLFYELYYNNEMMSQEAFDELMNKSHNGDVVCFRNSRGQDELIFLRNSFARGSGELNATIGVSISSKEIIDLIERLKWKENTEVLIFNDQEVLCTNGSLGDTLLKEHSLEDILETESKEVTIGDVRYHIVSIPSLDEDIHYVALTLQEDIHEEAQKIQGFMIVLMAVCLGIGVLIAYLLTRINYNPLKRVMDSFGEFNRRLSDRNEYEWLIDQKQLLYHERQEARRKIDEKEKSLRQQYLYRLVALPYDNRYKQSFQLSDETIFEKPNVLVALFYVEVLNPEFVYAKMDRSLERFVFTNVLEELLEGRINIELVDLADCFACIINSEKEIGEIREILEEVLDIMQSFMIKCMQMRISIVFGSYQKGIDGLHLSYMMAREAAEYRSFILDAQYIWYDDIKNRHTSYQYSAETEQKIINAISVGQAEDACIWIEEVIESNYHNREITLVMKKCLVYEIMGTIIKGAEQGSRSDYILDYMDEKFVPEYMDKDGVLEYIFGIVKGLCEDIRNNDMLIREDKQFGWQVIEYVQNNYQNPDLNISITALHFGITPSYLSALFKEQTGLNLLEYINHTRVEQAKKLLEEGCSLTEVCEKTGFRSSGALIRVFKKITGITPGQMKKMFGQGNRE